MPRERQFWIGSAAALLGAFVLVLIARNEVQAFYDFNIYRKAGVAAFQGGPIYVFEPLRHFQYSPFAAVAFGALIGVVSYDASVWVFYALLSQAWWCSFWFVARNRPSLVREVLLFSGLFAVPGTFDFILGQVNVIPLLCCLSAARWLERRPEGFVVPALLLGFALQFKLFTVLFLPILFFRGLWKVLGATAIVYLTLSFGVVALCVELDRSLDWNVQYVEHLRQTTDALLLHKYNSSVLGVGLKLGAGAFAYVAAIASLAFLGTLIYRRRTERLTSHAAVSLAAIPLAMPIEWSYWIVLAYPALSIGFAGPRDRFRTLAVTGILFVSVVSRSEVAFMGGAIAAAVLAVALVFRSKAITGDEPAPAGQVRGESCTSI